MSALKLTSETFASTIANADKPVLVDFWAPWCGPCRMLGPIIDELSTEKADTAIIAKLDIDDAPEIAAQYGVTSIPAILVFKGGKLVKTMVGVQPKSVLNAALNA